MASVDDDFPGVGDVYSRVLVPDPPEPGVLARLGFGVERVDLHDPAVVLRSLGCRRIVEPAVDLRDLQRLRGVVGALAGLALIVGALAVIVLEVLLAGEHGVPGRYAAATVGKRPYNLALPLYQHLEGAGGWSRYAYGGGRIYAAVVLVVFNEAPGVALLLHPDDRATDPGFLPRYLLLRLFGRALGVDVVRPEHGVYVFVVDPEDAILGVIAALQGVYGEVRHEVIVVTVGQATAERVAGAADDFVPEALGQDEVIFVGGLYGLEERWATASIATCRRRLAVLGPP